MSKSNYQSSLENTNDRHENEIEELKKGIKQALQLINNSSYFYPGGYKKGIKLLEKLIENYQE